jgi:hypothetical protein
MFNQNKYEAMNRMLEEKLYEEVVNEIKSGYKREGLWAKAIAISSGDEAQAKALYIQYRVQSMIDGAVMSQQEESMKEAKPSLKEKPQKNSQEADPTVYARRKKTKDPEYIICSKCNFEQWKGYEKCQKCGIALI